VPGAPVDPVCVSPGEPCDSDSGGCCGGTTCAQLEAGGRACALP